MLEVVFTQSAAGSMSIAMGPNACADSAIGLLRKRGDEQTPSQSELQQLQREVRVRERRNWASAVPFSGCRTDIFSFSLSLSTGEIDEQGVGRKREAALALLMGIYPALATEVVHDLLQSARNNLQALLARVESGAPIRVWSSRNADEACGLYWLMEQFRPIADAHLDVTLVKLPAFALQPGGTVVQYTGWGEVAPHQWGQMATLGSKLPFPLIRAMADRWNVNIPH